MTPTDDIHAEAAASTELAGSAVFSGGEGREIVGSASPLTIHRAQPPVKGRIILVPGWSGPRSGPADLLVFLASKLAAEGWEVVRMDLPGRGDAPGDFGSINLDEMIAAVGRTVSSFDPRPPTPDPRPPYLLGLCSGGNVALGVVSQPSALHMAGVIALSTLPFQPARTQTFENRRRWRTVKQYAAKAASPLTWLRLAKGEINVGRIKKNISASEKPGEGQANLKDSARDIESKLLHWKGTALFIWGGGDEETPPARAHFETLHALGMGQRGQTLFQTIEGANHNFYGRAAREQLLAKILDFL